MSMCHKRESLVYFSNTWRGIVINEGRFVAIQVRSLNQTSFSVNLLSCLQAVRLMGKFSPNWSRVFLEICRLELPSGACV